MKLYSLHIEEETIEKLKKISRDETKATGKDVNVSQLIREAIKELIKKRS